MTPPRTEKPPDDDNDDGDKPLTPEERAWIRHAMRDDQHAAWLRGRIKVFLPWIMTLVAAVVATGDWLTKHFTLK